MTPTNGEKKHAKSKGEMFKVALAAATMKVKSCNKLVGLNQIRKPIA